MKRFLSMLIAGLMLFALCIPALADEAPIFDTSFTRVNNEPTVEYDSWGVPYNVWVPATTPYAVGDTATIVLSYTIPESIDGFEGQTLSSIEFISAFEGFEGIELVEAIGCPGKMNCDYEAGFCMPVPGEYSNVTITNNGCIVMAELGSDVQIVLRGTVSAETINCTADITIGQYRFPAQYLIGSSVVTVEKYAEGFYNAHRSDFMLVQKRDIAYRNNANGLCDLYPALNGHYYHAIAGDQTIEAFIPVDENWEECDNPVDKNSSLFATLTSIMEEYRELFDICYSSASIGDSVFFDASLAQSYNVAVTIQNGGEAPVDPTNAPAEPTSIPVAPTAAPGEGGVPNTGAISFAIIGIAAIAGAGVMISGRKKN